MPLNFKLHFRAKAYILEDSGNIYDMFVFQATFSCSCDDQYVGTYCEEFDACQREPCQNNASCIDANEKQDGSNFTCVCLAGMISIDNSYYLSLCRIYTLIKDA